MSNPPVLNGIDALVMRMIVELVEAFAPRLLLRATAAYGPRQTDRPKSHSLLTSVAIALVS